MEPPARVEMGAPGADLEAEPTLLWLSSLFTQNRAGTFWQPDRLKIIYSDVLCITYSESICI